MTAHNTGARIDFTAPPPLGTVVDWPARNAVYVYQGAAPHRDRHGVATWVLTWAISCSTCFALFTVTSGIAGWLNTVRCPACRRKRRAAIVEARQTKGARPRKWW